MILIHLYEKGDWKFPKFPANTYEAGSIDSVLTCIKELLENHQSGISKVLIENAEFGDDKSLANNASTMRI